MLELFRRFWMWLLVPILLSLLGGCTMTERLVQNENGDWALSREVKSIPEGVWRSKELLLERTSELDPVKAVNATVHFGQVLIEGAVQLVAAVIEPVAGLLGLPIPEQPPPTP